MGPGADGDRLRSRMMGCNISHMRMAAPWMRCANPVSISLLDILDLPPGDPVGMELNWSVKSVSDVSKEVYAEGTYEKGLTRSADFPNLANFCRTRLR